MYMILQWLKGPTIYYGQGQHEKLGGVENVIQDLGKGWENLTQDMGGGGAWKSYPIFWEYKNVSAFYN